MAVSTTERLYLERAAIAKRQRHAGMVEGAFGAQSAKELGRGDYVQQVATPARKLVLTQRRVKLKTSSGIHSLKRRAITRQLIGRSGSQRQTDKGRNVTVKYRQRDRDRYNPQGPSGARTILNRPFAFSHAAKQAQFNPGKAARRGFSYAGQTSKNLFLGTRAMSDYAPAQMFKSRKAIAYQPY